MAFNLVLPQVLPRAKLFGAFLARILHPPTAVTGVLFQYVVTDKPLCYPYQNGNNNNCVRFYIWIFDS
ncbi:MAG: hypothetical protein M3288_05890 [Thermoproteota archaeon]|nr:hypothetical protein [Thermoproteota archaeon]